MARRWQAFGYEDALLSQSGEGIRRGIGVLEELLSPSKCDGNNIDCEDGIVLYSGQECPRCQESREDRAAERAGAAVQDPVAPQAAIPAARRAAPPPPSEAVAAISQEGRAEAAALMREALRNRARL
jgi:uncharacterized membrane protein